MSIRHKREIVVKNGRNRKKRQKSFLTQEKAKKWAEENKMKDFTIVSAKKGKRFMLKASS